MTRLQKILNLYSKGSPSLELKVYLKDLYGVLTKKPINLTSLKSILVKLFTYLLSKEGKTKDNYWTVDLFISDSNDLWKATYFSGLPESYQDIFGEIQFFHGALDQPEFHSNPEIILKMLKEL